MKQKFFKRSLAVLLAFCVAGGLTACGGKDAGGGQSKTAEGASQPAGEPEAGGAEGANQPADEPQAGGEEETSQPAGEPEAGGEETEIQVFIAASLNTVMTDLAERYREDHPNVKITFNADSSGKLLTQIAEGYACDIFFSAATRQMDQLEADGLVLEGSRKNVVNNQLVVLTQKDSGTAVKGLETLKDAKSIALAGGSVPVGKYTRQALVNLGILENIEDVSQITTQEISEALGGVEISEQENVSKVLIAVAEGACEVGTTYYSDTYGYEEQVTILERVSYDLTGDVIYPICLVQNQEADEQQKKAAEEFLHYVVSEEAKAIFESYYFDTEVE